MTPGPSPRKRLTHTKAAQRKTRATVSSLPNRSIPATENTTRTRSIWSPSPSPDPEVSRPALLPKSKSVPLLRRYSRKATSKLSQPSASQPIPPTDGLDSQVEEVVRAKKRRLTGTYSGKRDKSAGAYSTPDSSPPGPRSFTEFSTAGSSKAPDANPTLDKSVTSAHTDVDMKSKEQLRHVRLLAKTSKVTKTSSTSTLRAHTDTREMHSRGPSKHVERPAEPATAKRASMLTKRHTSREGPKRKRLIDALGVESGDCASSSEEDGEEKTEKTERRAADSSSPRSNAVEQNSSSASTFSSGNRSSIPSQYPMPIRRIATKIRMYGEQRSHLAENEGALLGGMDICGNEGPACRGPGALNRSSSAVDAFNLVNELDETGNSGAVQSLHELRQAGANSRFGDEMDDIFERIGSPSARPSSLRRGGLLEIAQKMCNTDFQKQFRDHRCSGNLTKRLDNETDVISAICITVTILILLDGSGSAGTASTAHLIRQLASDGVADLLGRLLCDTADIDQVSRDKKHNFSKHGQVTLSAISTSMMQLKVWGSALPALLSPRTLALKCLQLLHHQATDPSSEMAIFSTAITDLLFSILDGAASDRQCWDFPKQPGSIDFHLALSILLARSIPALRSDAGSDWTCRYAPIVARLLKTALRQDPQQFGQLESMAFCSTLNFANKNSDAAGLFANQGLLLDSAKAACACFEIVLQSDDGLQGGKMLRDSLILILGVMINLCEHYRPALKTMRPAGRSKASPVSRLIRIFASHNRLNQVGCFNAIIHGLTDTGQAESLEKTHLRVAIGYLAILLGYLCLDEKIRELFVKIHSTNDIEPLLESIRQFTDIYSTIMAAKEEEGSKGDTDFMERMEKLVAELSG